MTKLQLFSENVKMIIREGFKNEKVKLLVEFYFHLVFILFYSLLLFNIVCSFYMLFDCIVL